MDVFSEINLGFLRVKAKFRHLYKSRVFQYLLGADITFVFLFLGLYLWGYVWNWQVLLGCFGAWLVVKELFKYLRIIAKDFGRVN